MEKKYVTKNTWKWKPKMSGTSTTLQNSWTELTWSTVKIAKSIMFWWSWLMLYSKIVNTFTTNRCSTTYFTWYHSTHSLFILIIWKIIQNNTTTHQARKLVLSFAMLFASSFVLASFPLSLFRLGFKDLQHIGVNLDHLNSCGSQFRWYTLLWR